MKRVIWLVVVCCFAMALSACAPRYGEMVGGTRIALKTPILEQVPVEVPVPPAQEQVSAMDYRVGPGDVLAIDIPGQRMRVDSEKGQQGYRVYSSGKVLLPIVGGVHVAGLPVDEIQIKLQDVFKTYIKDPVVSIEILEFKSQPVYLLGSFLQPGVQYLDRPVTLIQGITLGGGLDPQANLRGARLVRNDRVVPVDIYELMYHNDLRHNIPLRANDTVYIPGNDQTNVFILGAVKNEGPVSMNNGRLSLLQALSASGLGAGSSYDHEQVRIIRSYSATKGELLVVDLDMIMSGQALPMPLMNGDIIYVPTSKIGNWNDALSQMLPSLQTIGAILQPFVQINYLKDN
jgi:polysaccharide export outer membrane protein